MKVTVWRDEATGEIHLTEQENKPNPTPREGWVWLGTADLTLTEVVSIYGRESA